MEREKLTPETLKEAAVMALELAGFMLPVAAGSVTIDLSDETGLRVTIRRVAKRTRKARKHDA